MAEETLTPDNAKPARKPRAPKVAPLADSASATDSAATGTRQAKAKFAAAIDEARAGAQALAAQAQDTAGAYREKLAGQSDALMEEARNMTGQAKEKATALAQDGKAKTAEGIAAAAKLVADSAGTIDEKLGVKYGDYARNAARSLEDVAARLDAKELGELAEDAREAVRKSPGVAIGVAAVAGFMLSRLFKGSDKSGD
jgi:hypothetical protein